MTMVLQYCGCRYNDPPAEPLDGWRLPFWLGTGGFAAAAGMLMGVEAV